jgi:hypothetical protein
MLIFPLVSQSESVTLSGNFSSLNLYNHVTGTLGVDVRALNRLTVIIPSKTVITATAGAALTIGDWPASISLQLVNNGFISGRGGDGGLGGIRVSFSELIAPTQGSAGATAIFCTVGCAITNNGTIQGGAGGGGGGSYSINGDGGGGGGGMGGGTGGIGNLSGNGGSLIGGGAGGVAVASLAGNGGNGGTWVDGGDGVGQTGGSSAVAGATGGQPGKAIDYNSNSVSVTDNGTIYGVTS